MKNTIHLHAILVSADSNIHFISIWQPQAGFTYFTFTFAVNTRETEIFLRKTSTRMGNILNTKRHHPSSPWLPLQCIATASESWFHASLHIGWQSFTLLVKSWPSCSPITAEQRSQPCYSAVSSQALYTAWFLAYRPNVLALLVLSASFTVLTFLFAALLIYEKNVSSFHLLYNVWETVAVALFLVFYSHR